MKIIEVIFNETTHSHTIKGNGKEYSFIDSVLNGGPSGTSMIEDWCQDALINNEFMIYLDLISGKFYSMKWHNVVEAYNNRSCESCLITQLGLSCSHLKLVAINRSRGSVRVKPKNKPYACSKFVLRIDEPLKLNNKYQLTRLLLNEIEDTEKIFLIIKSNKPEILWR
jgi:hypothetical protein